jgi:[ribosomal protein S5]-alanine N-acetyltransferase
MYTSIITDRLLISHLSEEDNKFILELVNTREWIEHIGNRNIRSSTDAIAYTRSVMDNARKMYWVVRLANDSTPIGIVAFVKRDFLMHYDVGFAFLPRYTGKGYAYESAKAVMEVEMDSRRHSQILGITNSHNIKAIRLLKRLGLEYVRNVEVGSKTMQLYRCLIDNSLSKQ